MREPVEIAKKKKFQNSKYRVSKIKVIEKRNFIKYVNRPLALTVFDQDEMTLLTAASTFDQWRFPLKLMDLKY